MEDVLLWHACPLDVPGDMNQRHKQTPTVYFVTVSLWMFIYNGRGCCGRSNFHSCSFYCLAAVAVLILIRALTFAVVPYGSGDGRRSGGSSGRGSGAADLSQYRWLQSC